MNFFNKETLLHKPLSLKIHRLALGKQFGDSQVGCDQHWKAYLQEAVLAAEELILLHDGLSGQDQFVSTESRLTLTREDCLKY